jgi:uncharacterized repeat protein (TIGR02543 family)
MKKGFFMKRSIFINSILLLIFTILIFTSCDGLGGFEIPSYTVMYLSNGGEGTMESSTHVYGTARNLNVNIFTREGYAFAGWSDSSSGEIKYVDQQNVKNLTKTTNATITLYAQWNAHSYIVVYNANGGIGEMEDSYFIYDVSENLRSNTFTNDGYNFAGWALSKDGLIEFDDEANVANLSSRAGEIITLYAQWAGYPYTIVYNPNSGIGTMPNSDFAYGISKNLSANTFTRSGYIFIGWALTENGSVAFEDEALVRNLTMLEGGTVTLFAQWLPAYSIIFIANDGIPSPTSPTNTPQGSKITEPSSMEKTGYTFDGWYKESGFLNKWNFTNDIPISDITLYAKWVPVTYSVTYDKNASDATGTTSSSSHIYDIEKNLTTNGFSRIGYKFSGWSTTTTGSLLYANEQSVKDLGTNAGEIVTLYAKWIPFTYTVIYNANGGSGAMLNSSFTYGTAQSLRSNSFTNTGYLFSGWATTAEGTVIYTNQQSVSNLTSIDGASVTLYAVWVENAIIVPGTTLNNKFTWLAGNAASNNTYIVEVNGDESIANISLSYSGKSNIVIKLRGIGGMRTISLSSKNRMFSIVNGVTLILDNNITLQGISDNSNSLINVGSGNTVGATLIMNANTLITGNITSSEGGGVIVENYATFIMNGGSISGNTSTHTAYARSGGGVFVSDGNFTMNDGEISNNNSSSSGAGVYVMYGTFAMNGGEIYGNILSTSNSYSTGGGVEIDSGEFIKTGGTIYGYSSGNSMSNVVKNTFGVVQNNRGHAIYASGNNGNVRRENDTGPDVVLSFNDPSGTWTGDWD